MSNKQHQWYLLKLASNLSFIQLIQFTHITSIKGIYWVPISLLFNLGNIKVGAMLRFDTYYFGSSELHLCEKICYLSEKPLLGNF